jgi:superfamily II DNA helicase RecQ
MRDQVKKLHDLGVSAVSLLSGIESDEEAKALDRRRELYSVLYGTACRVIVEDIESVYCIAEWFVLWLLMHEAHVSMYYNKS